MWSPTWPQLRPINWGTAVAVPHGWRWCLRRSEGCHQWHRDQPSPCQQHVLRHPSGEGPFFEWKMNHLHPFMDDLLTAYYIYLLKMVIFHIAIGENAIENHGKTCSSQFTPEMFCSFDGEITPIKIPKKNINPCLFPTLQASSDPSPEDEAALERLSKTERVTEPFRRAQVETWPFDATTYSLGIWQCVKTLYPWWTPK